DGEDHELCRINVLAFAAKHQLNEEDVIAAFLHAARLSIFDMSWNILCPGCGGVLDSGATLKTVKQAGYTCVLCAEECGARPRDSALHPILPADLLELGCRFARRQGFAGMG